MPGGRLPEPQIRERKEKVYVRSSRVLSYWLRHTAGRAGQIHHENSFGI
jgi:RNA:NAD 2'-phosphotransferase (TPT1/KptA family)